MKAVVYHRYGPPDVLAIADVEPPVPGVTECLVEVRAAGVNPLDGYFLRGWPYFFRVMSGVRRPTLGRPGRDLAGRVVAVGAGVTRFRPGDEVFGTSSNGTFAELVCANENELALKPATVSFEQAAAVPIAGITALQGLRDKGRIRPGQKVLVNGAAGGVGSFAVQIARAFGAEVTGVCSTGGMSLVRALGAAHVIDYTREDFARGPGRYDLVLDCVANRDLHARRRVLNPGGTYVVAGVGPIGGRWLGPLARLLNVVLLAATRRDVAMFVADINPRDLDVLKELMETGAVVPALERCYPLADAAEALRRMLQGHARGKIVVTVGH